MNNHDHNDKTRQAKIRIIKGILDKTNELISAESKIVNELSAEIDVRKKIYAKLKKMLADTEAGKPIDDNDYNEVTSLLNAIKNCMKDVHNAVDNGNKVVDETHKKPKDDVAPKMTVREKSPSPEAAEGVYDLMIFEDGTFTGMTT